MDVLRLDTGKEYLFESHNNHSLLNGLLNQSDEALSEQKSVVTKVPDLPAACMKFLELSDPNRHLCILIPYATY